MVRTAPLGKLLLETGALTQAELDDALASQKTDKRRLGEILVERGVVQPQELAQILSHQLSCPWISLSHLDISAEALGVLPAKLALEHKVVPVHLRIAKGQRVLYVATDDPTDHAAMEACAAAAGIPVRPMVALAGEVRAALTKIFGDQAAAPSAAADPPARPPTPGPPPLPSSHPYDRPSLRVSLDESDVVESDQPAPPRVQRAPTVLALNAPEAFLAQCKVAVAALSATLVDGAIMRAAELVAEHRPCAIVVTDDVYAFDRSGLNRLALDNDAHLVVWSEEVDGSKIEPLLAGAIDRWGRSSYEKGAIVDGRYELLRDLGDDAGPGASRWEVRNVRTARRSLLALAVRSEGGEAGAAAIRREQKALARITHPGAVELRDAGTTELGDPYVVLEPIEGRSLDGLMAARTTLVADDLAAVVVQVAEVLAAAHAAGVVHHHVVAENVVIARDGYGIERAKLTGWKRASVGEAPRAEAREDLLALGTCAFEALTGRRPKEGEDLAAAGLPERLLPVLTRALSVDPAVAFENAKDFAAAMQTANSRTRERTQLLDASPRSRDRSSAAPPGLDVPASRTPHGGPEQRRFARAPYRTPVRVEVPGIGAVDGRSEDISIGGLLVVSRGAVKAGTTVTIRFALPLDGRVVSEAAVAKWSRPARSDESSGQSAIGIELTSPLPETLRQIERYVSLMGDGVVSSAAK